MSFLNQNRHAACGQHKEEILCQLRELVRLKPDPYGNADIDPANILQSLDADPQPPNLNTIGDPGAFISYKVNLFHLFHVVFCFCFFVFFFCYMGGGGIGTIELRHSFVNFHVFYLV
jgi:hypothetical protein